MKVFKTAAAAVIIAAATISANAESTIGNAGIAVDFNNDGTADVKDWNDLKTWFTNYKMQEDKIVNYGNQEAPASFNLVIDKAYGTDAEGSNDIDISSVSQYYLPTIGDTTPVKDQDPFGTCWAFGSISTLESNILHKRHGNSGVINPDAFEMNLNNVSTEIDLSELYHAYMSMEQVSEGSQKGEGTAPLDPSKENANLAAGGFGSTSQVLFTGWTGPLAESQEPYFPIVNTGGKKDVYGLKNPDLDKTSPALAHVQEFIYLDTPAIYHIDTDKKKYIYDGFREGAVDSVKQAMIKYGALMLSYQADTSMPGDKGNSDYMNYEYFCQFDSSEEIAMNHMVTIVGWNDDYPRENFESGKGIMPKNNGAFLIKNSWGNYQTSVERYGDKFTDAYNVFSSSPEGRLMLMNFNYGIPDEEGHGTGYAWISYEDHSLFNIIAVDADDAADGFDYDHLYQYDFSNPTSFYPISLPTDNADTLNANVFTSERNETLAAVSVYAPENNVNAEIKVYRLSGNSTDPTEGELLAETTASFSNRGFHTVALKSPVALSQGDRFAVVESITTEKDGKTISWLNIEQTLKPELQTVDNINEEHAAVVSNPGETLVYVNDGKEMVWSDAAELNNTEAGKVMAFGNAYIKAYTVTEEKTPLPTADSTYQGVYERGSSALDTVLLFANLPKIIIGVVVAGILIIALIIFLIIRAIRKKRRKKAEAEKAAE